MVNVGLVGFGYWGPNLARSFSTRPECRLSGICELSQDRAELARQQYPGALITADYNELLQLPEIDAILIATPVESHFKLAHAALMAGKDILVEKPFTSTAAEAEELIALAKENSRIIAVDHTFLFTGAVQKIKEVIASGEMGDLFYIDSVRINLGLFQHDVNVIWDLAPHDISIINYLVDLDPIAVTAVGSSHTESGLEDIAYVHLEYPGKMIAHLHLNWLAPAKIRRTLIGGTKKMVVYDDMELSEKVKIYDKGIFVQNKLDVNSIHRVIVDYRTGDMVSPKLPNKEALVVEADHFIACVRDRVQPLVDGQAGLKVVRVLEATQQSIRSNGQRVIIG
ncbi:MAG: Gfo/Idh/MocA family oxidoreductase [Alphaproteobacteria bacterium]|nr:Gfo/Idh/MocA family oxidoreductase [Alphaproteobacteria bacterium]